MAWVVPRLIQTPGRCERLERLRRCLGVSGRRGMVGRTNKALGLRESDCIEREPPPRGENPKKERSPKPSWLRGPFRTKPHSTFSFADGRYASWSRGPRERFFLPAEVTSLANASVLCSSQ